MRIKAISVTGLFGIFNHEIPFRLDERITIIHGPNGYGKTVLLGMLRSLFSERYHELRRVPFRKLRIEFDEGGALEIVKESQNKELNLRQESAGQAGQTLSLVLRKRGQTDKSFPIKPVKRFDRHFRLAMIEEVIPQLEHITPRTWLDKVTGMELSLEDVLERYGDDLPMRLTERAEPPSWMKEIIDAIPVRFIETQRLLRPSSEREPRRYDRNHGARPAVVEYSEELARLIQKTLADYATHSQSLDRTFPTRLVKGDAAPELNQEQLLNKLTELDRERKRLTATGLLDKEEDIYVDFPKNIDESNMKVLSLYVQDVEKKLGVFDDMTSRIDLLLSIVNSRFQYKIMSISKKDGFVVTAQNQQPLPLTMLSSGEQHELVLLYEFLFKMGDNTLVLLDEPELSLHVAWQQEFLRDLSKVAEISNFDVLIATHSPQIIHDQWDLTVNLKGPTDEELHHR